jgi:hypothetical protein
LTVHTLELAVTAERAFAAFAAIAEWWDSQLSIAPRAHHRSGDEEWGEVTRWDPPRALAYTLQGGTVEVVFVSTGDRTIVRVELAGSSDDWSKQLARFVAHAQR